MGLSDTKARPAYMYEVDEDGRPIGGTKRSARAERQKPTVSHRSRTDEKRKPKSDSVAKYEAMMSGANQDEYMTEKEIKMERRKSSSSTKSPSKPHNRPPSAHGNKSFPKIAIPRGDHPSNFGISPTPAASQYTVSQPIPLRPRAVTAQTYPVRPVSYHATYPGGGYGAGPPLSASAYYQQSTLPAPSYPPPSPSASYMRYAATPQPEYFAPNPISIRPLAQRFGLSDPITRTSSAYGIRDPPLHQQIQVAYDDGYSSTSEGPLGGRRASIRVPTRRDSIIRKTDVDYDREAMPPPPRPGILRNRTTEYHPDTSSVPDPPYRDSQSTYRETSSTHRTPNSHRNSVSYDLGPETRVETANTSHRRQSYYGQSASTGSSSGNGVGWEEKAREAASYQEDVSGPAVTPLTAEALRRRHAGSSRSTKSSGSRDESDYRKSATTRTTRSGSGPDDDFTIKVKGGQARVMVAGAQIDCTEGGEIEIKRHPSIRNGSERSNSEYGGLPRIDDRRSRIDRPIGRSRRSSVSGQSYTRSSPQYPMGQYI
jgi:hypothetical protein